MAEYQLSTTQVIWNPTKGLGLPPVALVAISGKDDRRYASSWGACNADFLEADEPTKLSLLLAKFIHLVLNEGIDPASVHNAFVQIPQYRSALADVGAINPELV